MNTETEVVSLPPPTIVPMQIVADAIRSGIEPDKLGKLFDLARDWARDRAAEIFALAITGFQRECPMIGKGRDAKDKDGRAMYSYAAFEDIWKKVQPILTRHAIAVTFDTQPVEGLLSVTCKVRVGIHVETSSLVLPIPPATARCNATQAMASATQYGKRYTFTAALGIVCADEDDDAQSVVQPISEEQTAALWKLIDEREKLGVGTNPGKFAAIYGAETIGQIPAARFNDAKAELLRAVEAAKKAKVTK